MSDKVKATLAVDVIFDNLGRIPHPSGVIRLVQFAHDSPGLRGVKKQIAEGLILLLESQGWHLCNGLSEAEALLTEHGYAVLAPGSVTSV
jgi:hypothetical protein